MNVYELKSVPSEREGERAETHVRDFAFYRIFYGFSLTISCGNQILCFFFHSGDSLRSLHPFLATDSRSHFQGPTMTSEEVTWFTGSDIYLFIFFEIFLPAWVIRIRIMMVPIP